MKREVYRGVEVYGKSSKAYGRELPKHRAHRERGQVTTPEGAWLRRDAPELRIVSPTLADAVDARRADRAAKYLRVNGRIVKRDNGTTNARHLLLACWFVRAAQGSRP